MTEQEWLSATDPTPMLEFLQGKTSDRKLRLLAVACCRPLSEKVRLSNVPLEDMVDTAERFADSLLTSSELFDQFPEQDGRFVLFDSPEFYALDALGQRTCQATARLGWSPSEGPKWDEVYSGNDSMPLLVRGTWRPGEYATERTLMALEVAAQAWGLFASGCPYFNHPDTYGPWNERAGVPESYFRWEKERRVWFTTLGRDIFGNPYRPRTIDPTWLTSTVVALAEGIYADRAFDRMPILADALQDAGCDNADILDHCQLPGEHVRGCWVIDALLGKE